MENIIKETLTNFNIKLRRPQSCIFELVFHLSVCHRWKHVIDMVTFVGHEYQSDEVDDDSDTIGVSLNPEAEDRHDYQHLERDEDCQNVVRSFPLDCELGINNTVRSC